MKDIDERQEKLKHDELHILSSMISIAKAFVNDIERLSTKMILGEQEAKNLKEMRSMINDLGR